MESELQRQGSADAGDAAMEEKNMDEARILKAEDLWDLETYSRKREDFRRQVMEIKAKRRISIGAHLTLCFENRDTIFYQVMEMLRIENITTPEGIQQELSAYNPLIPGGGKLCATLLIEYEDESERRMRLKQLKNIEDFLWRRVGYGDKAYAQADEDLPRSNEEKTSAVHFLCYSFTPFQIEALKQGARLRFGCDHPHYTEDADALSLTQHEALLEDLRR